MDYLEFLFLGAIGVVGGVLSGLVGVGGGIVFVPGLLYVGGWNIQDAVAASLVIIIFSSLSGTIRNARTADPVNWRVAGLLSLAVAPSALIGVLISRVSPEVVVKVVFATLLIALAYPTARGGGEYESDRKGIPVPLVFLAGILVGTLSGLVGVGGGVVMVPLMVLGMGLTTKRAVSTSLAVVMFTGIVGAVGYVATGFRDVQDLLSLPPLIIGSVIGAPLGVRLRDWLPEGVVRIGFGVFMVIVALHLFAQALGKFWEPRIF
ncbi:MAG: sulfite exporter TauE/SafE family protein [Actinomycetota bacterium]|nr:sulfite exporter TauE/SafE family protein [Actinomycetota bacterium]HWS79765.1 sulfite exporter TauE/SafE family protein [Rubrobacter sp.]